MLKLKDELKDYFFGAILTSTILLILITIANRKFYYEAFVLQVIFYAVYFLFYKPIRLYLKKKKNN